MTVGVGVLLPLRIETRFWGTTLRVRVIPDDPWFDRHDPLPQGAELDALDQYVAAAGNDPRSAAARQAWRILTRQVGCGRAAWLLATFRVQNPDGTVSVRRPAVLRTEPRLPEIPFFPDQLQVWLARAGAPPTLELTLEVDVARLRVDFPDQNVPDDRRWWESWDEAVLIGLAGQIDVGANPDDIDVLYVTGLGQNDLEAAQLFAAHQAAGVLGLLRPGRPTNTVDGAPAADLGEDPETWLDAILSRPGFSTIDVGTALTGVPDVLGVLPNEDTQHAAYGSALVLGLWPALWGFAQINVWDIPHPEQASEWAGYALYPEGPYPTLRIGRQPYGLLPTTALSAWQAAPGDPTVEAGMLAALRRLRAVWAEAAEARGTIEGVDTPGLLDRLAQVPTSPGYRHRGATALQLWLLSLLFLNYRVDWRTIDIAAGDDAALAADLGIVPFRRYSAVGGSSTLRLPMVIPDSLAAGDTAGNMLLRLLNAVQQSPALLGEPDRLQAEVLITPPDSLLLRLAIRALQFAVGRVGRVVLPGLPWLEPIFRKVADRSPLEQRIAQVTSADLASGHPEARAFARVVAGLEVVAELADSDPDRLDRLLRATVDSATYRIDPWVTGPAARRLRDLADAADATGRGWRLGAYGWVDQPRPGTPGPTAGGMLHAPSESQAIAAMVLRDRAVNDPDPHRWWINLTSESVRTADRLAASVRAGAHLSEVLGREVERLVGDGVAIERLRRNFPMRPGHDGRRVCDGQAILAADPASLQLSAATLSRMADLRAGVEAYGDLLVAQAVYDVVEGRAETAGAVMDAAAGLARPPDLSVLRTRREGRAVSTTCVIALPAVDPPTPPSPTSPAALAAMSPGTRADPSFAAFLISQLGPATQWTWTTTAGTVVSLANLALAPVDALSLSVADLERLSTVAADGEEIVDRTGSRRHERAVRLATLLGQSPGTAASVAEGDEPGATSDEHAELRQRYADVRRIGEALLTQLRTGTPAERQAGLRSAAGWGICPADPEPVTKAAELLDARLKAAPTDPATIEPVDLSRTLVTLVSPSGQLAVLGRVPRRHLPSTLASAPALDEDWLAVVAAVRAPLARLEAHQLAAASPAAAGPALTAWSNRVADPWQTGDPVARLIALYAPPSFDVATVAPTDDVALAVLDRFSETIPGTEQATSVVFGFDAPASRAPQAILLAVPPDLDVPLDAAGVLAIVAETRLLAHARMARPADLDAAGSLLPTALFPATGPLATPLEPTAP